MNREIIFRGKRSDNQDWIYGYLYHDETGTYIKPSSKIGRFGVGCPVLPASVGQFTGIVSKTQIRIFEGDIIDDGYSHYAPVVWFSDLCQFLVNYEQEAQELGEWCMVAGNTFDNIDLLKDNG